jgi:hypothetical protein
VAADNKTEMLEGEYQAMLKRMSIEEENEIL